ncbi:BA14K family protein [Hoeflea sp. AS60]|uniref:BA14K family protein n=1 Tax=Hoeflea sp. AS60 TaxID=3135780 RepID=UPI00317B0156
MLKILMKSMISASFCLAALVPAGAEPLDVPNQGIGVHGGYYQDDVRHNRRGFYHHNKRGYYNGHRGYRQQRRGYREYNGYWFPPSAFSFGVIIGGQNRGFSNVRPGYTNPQHVRWCESQYRSYRARDNSFQPYHGPRRQCSSPFYSAR